MARKKKQTEPSLGHNGGPLDTERKVQLQRYVGEIERWETEKQEIADNIGEIYTAAKDAGFDTKAIRHIVKVRKADRAKQQALENAVDVYKHALGMLADLPLGQAGLERAIKDFGEPVELTAEERANGYTAAFIKDGTRMTIGLGKNA
jgi:uncharacterized protein (UPF0335 family)